MHELQVWSIPLSVWPFLHRSLKNVPLRTFHWILTWERTLVAHNSEAVCTGRFCLHRLYHLRASLSYKICWIEIILSEMLPQVLATWNSFFVQHSFSPGIMIWGRGPGLTPGLHKLYDSWHAHLCYCDWELTEFIDWLSVLHTLLSKSPTTQPDDTYHLQTPWY